MKTSLKQHSALWVLAFAEATWAMMGAGPRPVYAQKAALGTSAPTQVDQAVLSVDAQRGALDRFLDAHPEIENDVLIEPSLISNQGYLKQHAELEAFLEGHPLVKADPRAFISPGAWRYQDRRSASDKLLSDFVPYSAFLCFLLGVLWVLRALLENRRWNKSFQVHEAVHTKLIEKFASGQELTAYMQSDAGRRLLEWSPPTFDTARRSLPVALGRIISSLHVGMVMLLVGLGLLILIGRMAAENKPALLVFGTLGVTIGAAFILSALVAYGLSKRLGLIAPPPGSNLVSGR